MHSFIYNEGVKQKYDGKSYEAGFHSALNSTMERYCMIKALNIKGFITAITISRTREMEYNVRYFYNGEFKSEWLYDNEIEMIDEGT